MAKGVKGVTKVQHQKMKPIEGPGFSLRGFKPHAGNCDCGGILVFAKIAGIGGQKMGRTCAGRDALKRKGFFTTDDGGKTSGEEINEEKFRQAKAKADLDKIDPGVMENEVIVRPEIKPCGAILGQSKGNRFGAA